MATVKAGELVFRTNKLLIKQGKGYSVGLWDNSGNRYGYIRIPPNYNLVIRHVNAKCGVVKADNGATVFGKINKAIVGNCLYCEGTIHKAEAYNRTRKTSIQILTVDEKIKKNYEERIRICESMKGMMTPEQYREYKERYKGQLQRNKVIITINGKLDEFIIKEPNNISTELLINGVIDTINVGNYLQCKGEIMDAHAKNCIYATSYHEVTGDHFHMDLNLERKA